MKKLLLPLSIILLLQGLQYSTNMLKAQQTGKYTTKITFNGSKRTVAYYVPPSYDHSKKYPLMVGLHNCEGGTGIAYRNVLKPLADSLNLILVCPQGPATEQMNGTEALIIPAVIDSTVAKYNIDTTLVYLTGFSCNGQVTLEYGLKKIYPFKGVIPYDPYLTSISSSIYNFNSDMAVCICVGSNDETVALTLQLADTMFARKANISVNIMPGIGHTYDHSGFIPEMLESFRLVNQEKSNKFYGPESVVFDSVSKYFYISSTYSKSIMMNNGDWVNNKVFINNGLSFPLGLTILKNILYIADSSHIKGFAISSAEKVFDVYIPGSILLNGITSDEDSILYVSDYSGNGIYKINVNTLGYTEILKDYSIVLPNGVEFNKERNQLLIVTSESNGKIISVDANGMTGISSINTGLSSLDGLALDKFGNVYVSSWATGSVYCTDIQNKRTQIIKGIKGPADIYIEKKTGRLAVPDMSRNAVTLYNVYDYLPVAVFRGNAQRTNIAPPTSKGILKSAETKWKFKTNGSVISSPLLLNDVLYFGSNDSCLYAIDTSGNFKWKYKTGGIVTSSPAVFSYRVYFMSFDGNLYCIDANTGNEIWHFSTKGEKLYETDNLYGLSHSKDAFDFFLSSPVIEKGLVYFGSGDGNIYAIDAYDGKKIWNFQTGDVVHASPAIAYGKVYCGSWDRYFYSLDAATGSLIWKYETGNDQAYHCNMGIQASALIKSNIVYFGCRDANFYALDAWNGTLKWKYNVTGNSWILTSPAIYSIYYIFGTSDSKELFSVDATGTKNFSSDGKAYIYSSPAILANMGYFGTCGGRFFGVDLNTGNKIWEFNTDGSTENKYNLLASDGSIKEQLDLTSETAMFNWMGKLYGSGIILSSPVIGKGVIYFGSTDGNLYAIKEGSGYGNQVKNIKNLNSIIVNPNPVRNDLLRISLPENGENIKMVAVYDLLGNRLLAISIDSNQGKNITLSTKTLGRGIYVLKVSMDNGTYKTQKVIVE